MDRARMLRDQAKLLRDIAKSAQQDPELHERLHKLARECEELAHVLERGLADSAKRG